VNASRCAPLRRALGCLLACAAALGTCAPARAEAVSATRFLIVTGDHSALTRQIAADLRHRLQQVYAGARPDPAGRRRLVAIAIGPLALRELAARPCACVVIAAYTSSQVWEAHTAAMPLARALSMTAIYAEPAPADQLQLVALLYKRPVRVAAILSRDTDFLRPVLGGVADIQHYASGEDLNRVLNRISSARVLLALPDHAVYTAENIRNILLSTYRNNQAVIGFSADMVKAGALASTYSDIAQINTQVADVAADYLATGTLAPPQFPRYFSTIVNEGVARSLDVSVDAAARNFANRPPLTLVRLP